MLRVSFFSLLLALAPQRLSAQQDNLSDTQLRGRQLLAQSCGVCHLPTSLGAKTYGPPLDHTSAGGQEDIIHQVISDGGPRMPGFKYTLDGGQIDAIIAYLKTVPTRPTPPVNSPAAPRADFN